jgi:hypothetical protein
MLYGAEIAVFSKVWQNVQLLSIIPLGALRNKQALKG